MVEIRSGIKAQAFVELSKNTFPFGRFPMTNNNFSYNLKKNWKKVKLLLVTELLLQNVMYYLHKYKYDIS